MRLKFSLKLSSNLKGKNITFSTTHLQNSNVFCPAVDEVADDELSGEEFMLEEEFMVEEEFLLKHDFVAALQRPTGNVFAVKKRSTCP